MEYESRTNTNRLSSRRFTTETLNKISFVIFVAVLFTLLGLAGYGVYLLVVNVDGKQTFIFLSQPVFEKAKWEYTDWSNCTKTCGNGTMFRNVTCIRSQDKDCDQSKIEPLIEPCNTQQCSSGWRTGERSESTQKDVNIHSVCQKYDRNPLKVIFFLDTSINISIYQLKYYTAIIQMVLKQLSSVHLTSTGRNEIVIKKFTRRGN